MSNYLEKSKVYKGFHYSVLNSESLAYLHNKTLEMLKIIKPIFEKNNINYMICGGTLLGAVTTGKFIPWDDDVDICIMEEDYERAINLLIEKVPSWMFVQCNKTEQKYFHGWVKIRDKNSHVFPDIPVYTENGVWIDLYKLTKAKKPMVNYLIIKEHLDYLERRFSAGDITLQEKEKRINENNLIERLSNEKEYLKSISLEKEDNVFIIWSASKIVLNEKWVLPNRKTCFEGIDLYTFNNPTEYLLCHYGKDFTRLPPNDKRRVGINKIDFLRT